jgi:hypothetical protein
MWRNKMLIDFENIEEKCQIACSSEEYKVLINKVNKAKKIYLIGNGGLHFVACHMSTDLSRLIPDKAVFSFDSVGLRWNHSHYWKRREGKLKASLNSYIQIYSDDIFTSNFLLPLFPFLY